MHKRSEIAPLGGFGVHGQSVVTTFLFTDVEGSTRLWEQRPERMRQAIARHDAITRAAVEGNRGVVVKTSGDGAHAAFEDPVDALSATLELQRMLVNPDATSGVPLRLRCGLHVGVSERRDNDFFGPAVNRAARIMSIAHGGQVLLSEAVAALVRERLPASVSLRDLGAVRLRDLSNVERVYQVVHPDLRENFPALRSLEATPNNLPQQATTFIGREREIADARKALGTARLLTLLGAGGIGKTRLSLQIAADVLEDYPDGVWFVELAPLTDEGLVPQAVASVLGVKEEAGHHVTEALVKHVADRCLLLVLDNCEHLVLACATLAEQLLRSGPLSRILASSRELLRVSGEVSFPVPALAVPALRDPVAVEALPQYAAVRLFVDRAAAARPEFRLTEDNALAVAEICQRLDGIPLAIELAAARVRALSVETIAVRLNDHFQILTGGSRTALERQQTLRGSFDWSYDLLSDKERILFRRLAVFAGGWTLEAAETVCSGGDVDESEVLGLLADLVDKSLVMVVAEGGRYRLLETVRQYADERLTQSGESDATRSQHLAFFLAFAEKMAPELLGPEQAAGLQRLDFERENILSAHGWSLHMEGGAEQDYRLVHAIKQYWFIRGLLNLGHRVTVEAVGNSGGQTTSLARCKVLWVAGQISCWMGRYDEAPRYLQESLQTARALGDTRMVVSVLNMLTLAALGQGDRATARVHGQEAFDLASRLDNKRGLAVASNALAQMHRLEGELDAAEPLYERTVVLGRELGDRDVAAVGFLNLAMVAIERGAAERARALLGEVLTIAEQTGSKPAGQSALEVSAGLAALAEDWEHAARFYGVAESQTGYTGIQRDPADDAFLRPLISKSQEALGDLRFAAAYASGRALNFEEAIAEARAWLASGR
jgi:predicted ATPase/class 3 adenylate cyclase